MEDRWPSPTSSMANIYAPKTVQQNTQRKGWRFAWGGNGYPSDHSD